MLTRDDEIMILMREFGSLVGEMPLCEFERVLARPLKSGEFYQLKGDCVVAVAAGKFYKEENG